MLQTIKYAPMATLLSLTLSANEGHHQNRERIHSVRKVVDSIGASKAQKVDIVNSFRYMFKEAKVSGRVRSMYAGYTDLGALKSTTYSTTLGGIIKYELAQLNGFNAAIATYSSFDINFLSGEGVEQNDELSSDKGYYTDLAEVYINYKYDKFNLRVGRQVIDTPLADSDDIRMIQNSFEASVATLEYKDITFMLARLDSWQGYDQNINNSWAPTGTDGTYLGGLTYHDIIEYSAWYYDITGTTSAIYLDFGVEYPIKEHYIIHTVLQYLNESEIKGSGIEATVYGVLFEFVAHNISLNIAYNRSEKRTNKESFSGFGGGTLFTSMDTMILDNIASDREVNALVSGITYEMNNFSFLYAYGSFLGGKNSQKMKEHIIEQDIVLEYNVNDEFVLAARYMNSNDEQNSVKTAYDWNRLQVMVNYNF